MSRLGEDFLAGGGGEGLGLGAHGIAAACSMVNWNLPAASVVAVLTSLPLCTNTTVAPGMTAPKESVTVPVMAGSAHQAEVKKYEK